MHCSARFDLVCALVCACSGNGFIATAVFEKLVAWTLEANSVLDRPPVKVTRYTVDAHFGIWHTGTPPSFPPWAPLSEL